MATSLFQSIRRASSVLRFSYSTTTFLVSPRSVVRSRISLFLPFRQCNSLGKPSSWWGFRDLSYGTVNLVITEGKTKFETHEAEPPRKDKYKTKKKLKMQRKREKEKRKAANRKDPRRLGVKGKKKQKFANAEERIKCKLEKARIKESMLIERLKRYDIPKAQGPVAKPDDLTGEERFYLKKMAQKSTNYLQVGRRGLFGGVILNMHMHWKKHETVKVICKPCKPGQVHDYAQELARLSGGIPIHIIGDDTIIFYRGKNYEQPEVMSPVDTLSKKKALEKSKYEQSLESVRRFIAIAEKELELYYRHIALYGDLNNRNPLSVLDGPSGDSTRKGYHHRIHKQSNPELSSDDADSKEMGLSEAEDNKFEDENLSMDESGSEEDSVQYTSDDDKQREEYFTNLEDGSASSSSTAGSSPSMSKHTYHYSNDNDNQCLLSEQMPCY